MGSYHRKSINRAVTMALPFCKSADGMIDICASVEDRMRLADECGASYVYAELEKSNGKKVKFLMQSKEFRRLSKSDVNKLFKGTT